jgi:hypothetical protein
MSRKATFILVLASLCGASRAYGQFQAATQPQVGTQQAVQPPDAGSQFRYIYNERDGITYRETTHVVPHQLNDVVLEPREFTTYRTEVTTEIKEVDQAYQVPVTEYKWVPYWQTSWNPFSQPFLAYRQMAVTRYETRTARVKVPVTHQNIVPQKQTQQVAVSKPRMGERRYVTYEPYAVGPVENVGGQVVAVRPSLSPSAPGTGLGGVDRYETEPLRQANSRPTEVPPAASLRR